MIRLTRDSAPARPAVPANRYQAATAPAKLRGRFYTPPDLVRMMLEALPLGGGQLIVDPSCGAGGFLVGVVEAVAGGTPPEERPAVGARLARRLVGFEIDAAAAAEARSDLAEAFREQFGLEVRADELCVYQCDPLRQPRLEALLEEVGHRGTGPEAGLVVVGNPPYVEAKRLSGETKTRLKATHPEALSGAPDLYLYFMHVCLGWLQEDDTLAFVLPNKLLVNANAQNLRERLLLEGRLRALWFATQAGVFEDAAVYPIVLFCGGERAGGPFPVQTTHLTRANGTRLVQSRNLAVEAAAYSRTASSAFFPPPETPALRTALDRLTARPAAERLGSVLDIRWTVSFHRAGLRERYVLPAPPDSLYRRRFLGGGAFSGNGEVSRYRIRWAGWWIDYDEDRLRAEGNCVPGSELFTPPRVVICQNGRTLRAAVDEEGFILKDTFLCGVPIQDSHPLSAHPRALAAVLCSRAVHFFYAHLFYGGHVNSGYLHFLRSFLVDIPLGQWTDETATTVSRLARQREEPGIDTEAAQIEEQIEGFVSAALELSEVEQRGIAEWAAEDRNWQARERVRIPGPRRA